jgi:class 3 adenylate cyclase
VERRLAAILAADVVSYSRLVREDEASTLAALKAHREELFEPKLAQYHGRIVKLMGDGVLAEFPSAVEAVQCAIEIQHAMGERNAGTPEDQQIVYRVGINIGDIVVEDDDIYGDGVNVAARLEGLADASGICVSRNVYNQVKDKLDLTFEHLGEKEVKKHRRASHGLPRRARRQGGGNRNPRGAGSGQTATPVVAGCRGGGCGAGSSSRRCTLVAALGTRCGARLGRAHGIPAAG